MSLCAWVCVWERVCVYVCMYVCVWESVCVCERVEGKTTSKLLSLREIVRFVMSVRLLSCSWKFRRNKSLEKKFKMAFRIFFRQKLNLEPISDENKKKWKNRLIWEERIDSKQLLLCFILFPSRYLRFPGTLGSTCTMRGSLGAFELKALIGKLGLFS